MVIMNDLEWSMMSYHLFEKFGKIMQQTEKEALTFTIIV